MRPNFNYLEERAEDLLVKNNLFKAGFNVKKLAELLKINLKEEVLSDDVSGFFVMTDTGSIITYNKNNGTERKRFTIAHELGHFILHSKEQPIFIDKTPSVMFRNNSSSTGEDFKEREANAFAASLLMPKKLIEEEILNAPNDFDKAISYLATTFKVSQQAMSFRLSNLGYGI
ncbi:ImmA/IrrE family metallo-endopeptidase [Flavobacterium psychrophilum]|uniref:ImmA/IrrE family metallo-endopeptidase n=1 Tax=Flavobacterium psychrophilum TaxID=96345 RepID=UPI00106BA5FB|nr:ImmA/IrrE family metallo-endopeptidase [Flavobacterium psychrophilum]